MHSISLLFSFFSLVPFGTTNTHSTFTWLFDSCVYKYRHWCWIGCHVQNTSLEICIQSNGTLVLWRRYIHLIGSVCDLCNFTSSVIKNYNWFVKREKKTSLPFATLLLLHTINKIAVIKCRKRKMRERTRAKRVKNEEKKMSKNFRRALAGARILLVQVHF